jgi:hypothetical protein
MFRKNLFSVHAIKGALGLSIIFSLWLLTHPYRGILHDARLYTVQALFHIHPEVFKNDLFFKFGSQDQYSIFSSVYALAIKNYGLDSAALIMTILGQTFWVCASGFLLNSLFRGALFWPTLLALCVLPGNYGPENTLSYGEPFITARIFGEAASLIAIGLAIRKKWIAMVIALIISSLLHPLMALPAIVILAIYKQPRSKLTIYLGIASILISILLATLKIRPFTGLIGIMDETWYELAIQRAPFLVLSRWPLEDWVTTVLSTSILLSSSLVATGPLKRILRASLVVSGIGITATLMGEIFLKNALLIQLQPWRALWLSQWLATVAYVWFAVTQWRRSDASRMNLMLTLSAWLTSHIPLPQVPILLSIFAPSIFYVLYKSKDEYRASQALQYTILAVLLFSIMWFITQHYFLLKAVLNLPDEMGSTNKETVIHALFQFGAGVLFFLAFPKFYQKITSTHYFHIRIFPNVTVSSG